MTYNELISYFMDGVRRSLPEGAEVSFLKIPQINRDSVDVLRVVRSGQMISPAICVKDYWNRYYAEEATPETLLREIVDIYDVSTNTRSLPESHLKSYSEAKEHLYPILLNPLRNRELLQTTPHRQLLDLAIVSAVFFIGEGKSMTMSIVGRRLLDNWGIPEETLMDDTIANQQRLLSPIIVPIEDMISTLSAQESARQNPEVEVKYPETTLDDGIPYSSDKNCRTAVSKSACEDSPRQEAYRPDTSRPDAPHADTMNMDAVNAGAVNTESTFHSYSESDAASAKNSRDKNSSACTGNRSYTYSPRCINGSDSSSRRCEDESKKTPDCIPMYVMTNRIHHYGASSILDKEQLKLFSDRIGSDLYILPSSIHEVILICKDEDRLSYFQRMVQDINSFAVSENEWLADAVYEWNRETQQITIAGRD